MQLVLDKRGDDCNLRAQECNKIEWRRCHVLELSSKGHNQSEIVRFYKLINPLLAEISHTLENNRNRILENT